MIKRCVFVWPFVVLTTCVGCVSAVPGEPDPAHRPSALLDTTTPPDSAAPPRLAPSVPEPKDARGIAPCDLLTDEQLLSVGLIPGSGEEGVSDTAPGCSWSSSLDATNPAGLQINTDTAIPALDGIYLTPDVYAVFEPTEVAGHPALRADYIANGVCTIYTGIADHQAVATKSNVAGRPLADPCDIPRRMAEFILSNLPPLT
jgi:hypothetical protein